MNKDTLKKTIIDANTAYRSGNQLMSDSEYDALVEEFQNKFPDEYDDFRDSLNEGMVEYGAKVHHKFIMGSLDKIKNSDVSSLQKFIKKNVKSKLNVSAKVDGISSVAHYVDGKLVSFASRGDGYDGTDFTDKAPYVKGLLKKINDTDELFIRGELVILNDENIDSTTNLRNVCAGYMNTKHWSKDDISKVTFVPYTVLGTKFSKIQQFDLLEMLGFKTAWHESIYPEDVTAEMLTEKAKLEHEYSCDGLVLMDDDAFNEQDAYRPKNAMAFKINELTAMTKVIDISFEGPSKDGQFVPVAILDTIVLGDANVSRATCHNLDYLEEKNIKYGSVVKILKSGDIIPQIIEVVDNADATDIEFPDECPCCGSKLIKDGLNYKCPNKDCKDQVIKQIAYFIKKLGCKHSSEATLENFGIESFESLVKFIPDKKYKSQVKLYEELSANVFNKPKQDLIAATNFCGVGEKQINKIIDFYGLENVIARKYNGYPDGIGEATLQKFKDDILKNLKIVDMFINDSRYNCLETSVKTLETSNGMSVCFTGALNTMSRAEASKKAESAGFEVKSGVSKGLTYLVTNTPDSGSSKNTKAQKLGTKVITEEEFLKLVSNVSDNIMDL